MSARPRLLLFGPLPATGDPIGGTTVSFAALVDRFRTSGTFEVEVVDTYRRTFGVGSISSVRRGAAALFRVITQAAFRAPRADVVLFNVSAGGFLWVGPLVWLVTRLAGRTLAVRVFGGDVDLVLERAPRWLQRLSETTVLRSSLLLLQTEALCRSLSSHAKVAWFPTTRCPPSEVPRARERCRKFLFLSQLRPEKGVMEALDASDRLPDGCTLTLHGPEASGGKGLDLSRHLRARWMGEVSPERVQEVLFEHDALVFPSWYSGEGLPGAVIEALQCGLPVVATKWRAIEEIVEHEMSGLLVAPRDVDELSRALNRLAEDPELYARLGRGARVKGERFQAEPWHSRLEGWLLALCEDKHAHPLPL